MQKLELTLAIIKPHAIKNPVAVSYIRNILKNKFIIVQTKRVLLDKKAAGNFYKEHAGKFFYNRLVTFMTSGSIDLHVLGHANAIEMWRQMLGPTSVYKAQFQNPYCLRGMFGISDTRNVAHGSDSMSSAEREIKFFFPDFSFYKWHHDEEESKYRISRRGRKLQIFDDQRTLVALPKDVPERIWAEILQKEENELIVFDIREEILDDALKIGYQNYMERQNTFFTAHCAAQAWLKLINWFPGKVNICSEDGKPDDVAHKSAVWTRGQEKSDSVTPHSSENTGTESEVLQKVTDYSTEELSKESSYSALKSRTPEDGSLHGAGDSTVVRPKRRLTDKMKTFSRASVLGRSKATLPPLNIGDSRSRISIISDCRLRNLRLDTQYEISSEKVDTPPGEPVKRK